jgi:predicted outer membrane repeat protein
MHVVTGASDAVLDGFTISSGRALTGETNDDEGGGMLNVDASPQVRNCRFIDNFAKIHGGAIANIGTSSPILSGCVFSTNSTEGSGGAIGNTGAGTVTISDCTFINNFAQHPAQAGDGGAIFCGMDATVNIDGCLFEDNHAVVHGGAIYNIGAFLTINDSSFLGNYLPMAGGANGGALCVSSSLSVEISGCIFRGNAAEDYARGGAIYLRDSTMVMVNSVIAENILGGGGDAFGAGLYANNSTAEVTNCTFYENSADALDEDGGAIYVVGGYNYLVTNTILWGNLPNQIAASTGAGYSLTFSNNQDGAGNPVDSNIDDNPGFVGGSPYDLHLQPTSPCIDAGTMNGAPSHDLEGVDRPVGEGYDMGAYECY